MSGRLQNQLITLSEMSELVAIASKTEEVDDFGDTLTPVTEPTDFIRAKVRYDSTNEQLEADQLKFTTFIKVWTRFNSNWSIEKLVFWKSNYYEIIAIETTPGDRYHVIKARLKTT